MVLIGYLHRSIGLDGLLLIISHLFAILVLVFWVGLKKKQTTKLEREKYFCKVTYVNAKEGLNDMCPI